MGSQEIARIAVDAMGGDHGPSVVVPGAVEAQRQLGAGVRIVLFGDEALVRAQLDAAGASHEDFEIVHAPTNIEMTESPTAAIRRKRDSPIVMASEMLRDGLVHAHVSAGSTGAMTAASTLIAGRIEGVRRPGIATLFPTREGMALFIDVGANVDSKPVDLLQFAAMGRIYCERVLGLEKPGVGLLNIGEEPSKGDDLTLAAHALLQDHEPNFLGNIEGREMFDGRARVLVADGFVGNVVLKVMEGFGSFLLDGLKEEVMGDWRAKMGALLMKPAMSSFKNRFDYAEYGGAPLLGCQGVIIICHGGSSARAITNAIRVAEKGVRDQIPTRIAEEIAREAQALEAAPSDDAGAAS